MIVLLVAAAVIAMICYLLLKLMKMEEELAIRHEVRRALIEVIMKDYRQNRNFQSPAHIQFSDELIDVLWQDYNLGQTV